MTRPKPFKRVAWTERFERDYKRLSPSLRKEVDNALRTLMERDPLPKSLNFEKLKGYSNPAVYTFHVTPNHSHKASAELRGETLVLLRLGTHKKIDRDPC